MRAVEIEPLLEVDVDDVIAAHRTVERASPAVHVDPLEPGQFTRLRKEVSGDVLEVLQFVCQLSEQLVGIRGGQHDYLNSNPYASGQYASPSLYLPEITQVVGGRRRYGLHTSCDIYV